jgi:hypothetical protein
MDLGDGSLSSLSGILNFGLGWVLLGCVIVFYVSLFIHTTDLMVTVSTLILVLAAVVANAGPPLFTKDQVFLFKMTLAFAAALPLAVLWGLLQEPGRAAPARAPVQFLGAVPNPRIREPPRGGVLSLAEIPEARRTDPLRYSDIEAGEDVVRSRVGTDAQGQPIYVYMDSTMWRDAMDVGFQGARQYLHPVTRGVVQPDQVSRHTLVARKRHRRKQTPKKK